MIAASLAEQRVEVHSRPSPRRDLTRDQLRNRRHEDWLIDHEIGRHDPVTKRLVRRPVSLIAALYGCSEQTVRNGIASARALREMAAHVAN